MFPLASPEHLALFWESPALQRLLLSSRIRTETQGGGGGEKGGVLFSVSVLEVVLLWKLKV